MQRAATGTDSRAHIKNPFAVHQSRPACVTRWRNFGRGPIQHALETDWLVEVPVLCEPVSLLTLLICRNRDFFVNRGLNRRSDPILRTRRKENCPKSIAYMISLFFGRTGLVTAQKRLLPRREQDKASPKTGDVAVLASASSGLHRHWIFPHG
jgi:hypothetical protein